MKEGNILKMENELRQGMAYYHLPISDQSQDMNALVGKEIELHFTGEINCIATGEKIKKTFNQGYSYKAFMRLAACDICIVKPELCHYHLGTCREPEWGEVHCMQPHIVYLADSSGVKVGITRQSQVPHRWLDQGAVQALPILKVKNRYISGLIEVELAKIIPDKTNWRQMLAKAKSDSDLSEVRSQILPQIQNLLAEYQGETLDNAAVSIAYPIKTLPIKWSSLSFDKTPTIAGELIGIKGQYLFFPQGVLNIRKFQGYKIKLSY